MTLRYLFGPVTAAFADEHLDGPRGDGTYLTFGGPGTDLTIGLDETWEDVCRRLPGDWRPDFLALTLAYTSIPDALWQAPVPLVGLAADSNLLWHAYSHLIAACDLVLTDTVSLERLRQAGHPHAIAANLYGLGRSYLGLADAHAVRDLDVLFVGNLHPAVQRERLSWLGRLARLAERWRVELHTGVFGAEYRSLLERSRIVFNRSARQECNMRALEATAAGALLFQEAENREVPDYLVPGEEYVAYSNDNLEALLEHYLTHDDDRRRIAEAGQRKVRVYRYEALWQSALDQIEAAWPELKERCRRRVSELDGEERRASGKWASLLRRTWQMLSVGGWQDTGLWAALEGSLMREPFSASLRNWLGLAAAQARQQGGPLTPPIAHVAGRYFYRAVQDDPENALLLLNLAEALVGSGFGPQADASAERALALCKRPLSDEALVTPHFPPCFDLFHVEWERAGWDHAGRPEAEAAAKRDLVRWRLHALLADLTGELRHYEEAVRLRRDLPITQAALGCAWARAGQPERAIPPLRLALKANPFDLQAARALFQVLGDAGDSAGQGSLAHERRLLCRAAPKTVPAESWFSEEPVRRAVPTPNAGVPALAGPRRIVWEGDQLKVHSLAHINRQICTRLLARGHSLSLHPGSDEPNSSDVPADWRCLTEHFHQALPEPAEVHVRHQWPPNFQPPSAGRWVLMQPWEFGSLPKAWIEPIISRVDEVWVPSRFVRDCFIQSGVSAEQVQVIPLGADPARFHPDAPPLPLRTRKGFKFLFVGGTLHRKGIDILLSAYTHAFHRGDDVCLVIKDMGVGTFYRGQTAEAMIAEVQAAAAAPEIEYLKADLTEDELAGLYAAGDCLVHPYRGEGFGLPIAEAMAAGLPVLVTGLGAALDFCSESNAYLLPAVTKRFAQKRVGELETVDYPWLAEPDAAAFVELLRHVAAHPSEAKAKGQAGRAKICAQLTWEHATAAVEKRLHALAARPLRRTHTWITVPGGPPRATAGVPAMVPEDENAVGLPVIVGAGAVRVSLTVIVRNEEANLGACLDGVADLVDEIVVVDTGSTDRTKEIAVRYGAKVFDFPWCDSFAAARNEALRHASGPWIFWLDADDRLDEPNRAKLGQLLAGLRDENAAYSMKCLCLPENGRCDATVVDHVRLFRNHPAIRWEHRVHEQILPGVRRVGGEVRFADVTIQHTGYRDPALRATKLQRDLRLVELELAEQPEHPFTLFNLGSILQEQGRHTEALAALQRSLERSHPSDSIVRKLYGLIAGCHRLLGQLPDALAACQEGRRHYPDDPELLFREGVLRAEQNDLAGAADSLERLLTSQSAPHFGSVSAGLQGNQGRHVLADVYRRLGRHADAEAQWRMVVTNEPGFQAAWLGLAELYLTAGRWPDFTAVVEHLKVDPQANLEAAVLQARQNLAHKEFATAQQLLQTTIQRWPRALWPRVILSHALLQEGRDLVAAEQALRDVLTLDPGHPEARHNLAVLLDQQNRPSDGVLIAGHTLAHLYHAACTTPSEVHEHLPRLYALASACRHVTLFGTRHGAVATALLFARPEVLVCYDRTKYAELDRLQALAGPTFFRFHPSDVRQVTVEETELLVIDTRHDYQQLRQELKLHASNVRKYLAILGTSRYAQRGETEDDPGLRSAIAEFLADQPFRLLEQHPNNQGLMILQAGQSGALA